MVITTTLPVGPIFNTTLTGSPAQSVPASTYFPLPGRTIDLPLDNLARQDGILDVFVKDVVLPHLFKCMNCEDVLALSDE